jgi:hypothetical protein
MANALQKPSGRDAACRVSLSPLVAQASYQGIASAMLKVAYFDRPFRGCDLYGRVIFSGFIS